LNTLTTVDLSGRWGFVPENGEQTTINVPGGGWLNQGFDCEAATYETHISVPDILPDQSVFLELGAVNHIAAYYIGKDENALQKIHEEVTAFTPQCVDLTPYVQAGQSYLLRVDVRAYENGRPVAPHWAEWSKNTARGIFRSAQLFICPPVVIRGIFVKTDVRNNQLRYEFELYNSSRQERETTVSARLTSHGEHLWAYPELPENTYKLKAREIRTLCFGPFGWTPGPDSYWRPNQPYRAGYRAILHTLSLQVDEALCDTRFGFRELRQEGRYFTLNGIRLKFRGDNLQVANYDGIDHNGKGDAIDTLPGFLPPGGNCPGWPGAVDNFLRLHYNVQREHMGPWTPYMIDVCDEMGLMLIGESACRWNEFDMDDGRGFHEVKCLKDIIKRDRNHPSIVRWSSKNEAQCVETEYHVELYDAIKSLDDTRPIFEDIIFFDREAYNPSAFGELLQKDDFTWIEHYLTEGEDGQPYFSAIEHNDCLVPLDDRPYGIGEANWMRSSTPAGLVWFATTTAILRAKGASDVRPYTLLSSWASCIPGCRTKDFLTEEGRHPVYGEDNLPNPFEHPGIRLLQLSCNPIFAMDYDFWHMNRKSNAFGAFPVTSPVLPCNSDITRKITVFNDDLSGESLELHWKLREGNPSNWIYQEGRILLDIPVAGMAETEIKFRTPEFNTFLFLHLVILKDGQKRSECGHTFYETAGGKDFTPLFNCEERTFI